MARKRILLAFGTRPEAIKLAPLVHALRARPEAFEVICCVTGQHRALLDTALADFGISPDIDLAVMTAGQTLAELNAAVLAKMRAVLERVEPELVIVHGDTTSTLASALAAFYAGIPVAHVEAGLRSGRIDSPFPEEFNRRAVAMVASVHFAPTEGARQNLLAEGVDGSAIAVTGNTAVDALHMVSERIDGDPLLRDGVERRLAEALGYDWRQGTLVLVTCHRREEQAVRLPQLCAAIGELASARPELHFVIPLHPNPAIRHIVAECLQPRSNVHPVAPLDYAAFVWALRHCQLVLTDSGGIQEEAPSFGKPVLLLRDVTERPEGVAAGGVRVIGGDRARIVAAVTDLLDDEATYARMAGAGNPFGDGAAARRMADHLAATGLPQVKLAG